MSFKTLVLFSLLLLATSCAQAGANLDRAVDRDFPKPSSVKIYHTPLHILESEEMAGPVRPVGGRTEVELVQRLTLPFDIADHPDREECVAAVRDLAAMLSANPDYRVSIEGHTWDVGRDESNLILSKKKAEGLKGILVQDFGLSPSRIMAVGLGSKRPVMSNATQQGRRANRRLSVSVTRFSAVAAPLRAKGGFTLRFASGEKVVDPDSKEKLERIGRYLRDNPRTKAVIHGHTDDRGEESVNLRLSRDRADLVKIALITRFGISASRLESAGFGEEKPLADNNTEKGREINRRVEVSLSRYKPAPGEDESGLAPDVSGPGDYSIEISVSDCRLWLYKKTPQGEKRLIRPYIVATAKKGLPYPQGKGFVTKIDLNPWWFPTANMKRAARKRGKTLTAVKPGSPANPMGAFKIHLSFGGDYRIHGTNRPGQIGRRVSLGCVRMMNDEGRELAEKLNVGAEVLIH